MPASRIILIILAILAVLYAVVISLYIPDTNETSGQTAEQNTKALIGGPFNLTDHHGKSVTEQDFRGKYMLVYFGYTYCPDICPADLLKISNALDQISPATLNAIKPIFITFDPERDTVKDMAAYVQNFHPLLIGLTGSVEQIKVAKKSYRVYSAKEKMQEGDDPNSYTIGHTSYIYLMDRKGEYVTHFRSDTQLAEMVAQLEKLIH